MLSEVFSAVFSKKFFSKYLYLVIPSLVVSVITSIPVVFLLIPSYHISYNPNPPRSGISIFYWVVYQIISLILNSYFMIPMIELSRQVRNGENIDFHAAFIKKWKKMFSILGASLVLALFVAGFIVLMVVIFALSPLVGIIAAIVIFILLAYVLVKWYFYQFAIVVDDARAIDSLKKSWNLTKGYWWSIFGTFLVLCLVVALIFIVPVAIVSVVLIARAFSSVPNAAATQFSQAFMAPFMTMMLVASGLMTPLLIYGLLEAYYVMKASPKTSASALSVA